MADLDKFKKINEEIEKSSDNGQAIINGLDLESMMYVTNMELLNLMKTVKASQEDPKNDVLKAQIRLYDISVYNRSRALTAKILDSSEIWVIYSTKTRRMYRVGDFAAMCLTEDTAKTVAESIAKNGYEVEIRKFDKKEAVAQQIFESVYYGFRGIRVFYDNIFVDILPKVIAEFVDVSKIQFPENMKTRFTIINFSQEYQKNNMDMNKVRGEEYAMYDAMFKSTYLAMFYPESNGEGITFPMLSTDKESTQLILPVYTDEVLFAGSAALKIAKSHSDDVKYRKFTFDQLIEFMDQNPKIVGFVLDAETIRWTVTRQNIDAMKEIKKAWEKNGNSFRDKSKTTAQAAVSASEEKVKQAAFEHFIKEKEETEKELAKLQDEMKKHKFSMFGDGAKQKKELSQRIDELTEKLGEIEDKIEKYKEQ